MGEKVAAQTFSGKDRQNYREKLRRCLDVFGRMLNESKFEVDVPLTGMEIEFNLVDDGQEPAMRNDVVLDAISEGDFQAELARFNIEINVPPSPLAATSADEQETQLRQVLNNAEASARTVGAHIVMIGTLPTLTPEHLTAASLSPDPRYKLLDEQIFAARGEDLRIAIEGPERLDVLTDTIAPEAACTSVQFHIQVNPGDYAFHWNAAQCIAGVQVALGANSPFFFGKELWRETRIALFEQATDTRPQELKAQGVRPRVWFGERWITSVFDHFEENVRYFPALLPVCDDEDPAQVLADGGVPRLAELRIHNGTIYRWNRPVYDIHQGVPHLRVENRCLPAGPTVVDVFANGAFYFGLLRTLATQDRPVWSQMSFATAEDNFTTAARDGIHAQLYWPGIGTVPVTELVLRRLLPLARQGLESWGVDPSVSDRLLGVIERRCITHRNGAEWQVETLHRIERQQPSLERHEALREMLRRYIELMHTNEPVDSWPID